MLGGGSGFACRNSGGVFILWKVEWGLCLEITIVLTFVDVLTGLIFRESYPHGVYTTTGSNSVEVY